MSTTMNMDTNRSIIHRTGSIMMMGLLIILLMASSTKLPWADNFEEAKSKARLENKHILIVFSGSDWCRNCIILKQEVLEDPEFEEFALQHVIMLNADFPRKKKNRLSEAQITHNSDLAKRFNPQGDFPKVLLLDEHERVLFETGYQPGRKVELVTSLKKHLDGD